MMSAKIDHLFGEVDDRKYTGKRVESRREERRKIRWLREEGKRDPDGGGEG
jgi:hypothetical protein